jgi:hypothetical protein
MRRQPCLVLSVGLPVEATPVRGSVEMTLGRLGVWKRDKGNYDGPAPKAARSPSA